MVHRWLVLSSSTVALAAALLTACSSSKNDSGFDNQPTGSGGSAARGGSGGSTSGGSTSGGSTSGGAGGLIIADDAGGTAGTGPNPGNGNPELCDGLDNNANGIIDDVDTGGDGICDCLRIATLGEPGTHGQGDIFASWLESRSDNGAVHLHAGVLTEEELNKHQVIVAQDLNKNARAYTSAEVTALQDWINKGGGLMTLIGYADPNERTNVNALLAPHAMSYGAQPILQKQGGNTVPVTTWVPHPTTDGISKVGVDNGYPVDGAVPSLASEGGFDLARGQEVGKGHVFMWGDEWITYNSEWQGHPEYQVERFWLNVIKWLTPKLQCQVPIPPDIG